MTTPQVHPSERRSWRAFGRGTGRPFGRGGVARLVIGLWLAVHGLVVVGTPIVDALVGHADAVVAHWEDAQDTSCPPVHDPATCQLCQQITTGVGGEAPGRPTPVAAVRAATFPADGHVIGACEAALRGAPDPRGPPAA